MSSKDTPLPDKLEALKVAAYEFVEEQFVEERDNDLKTALDLLESMKMNFIWEQKPVDEKRASVDRLLLKYGRDLGHHFWREEEDKCL